MAAYAGKTAYNERISRQYQARKAKHLPEILKLKSEGLTGGAIAKKMAISSSFIYRVLEEEGLHVVKEQW